MVMVKEPDEKPAAVTNQGTLEGVVHFTADPSSTEHKHSKPSGDHTIILTQLEREKLHLTIFITHKSRRCFQAALTHLGWPPSCWILVRTRRDRALCFYTRAVGHHGKWEKPSVCDGRGSFYLNDFTMHKYE